MVEFAFNFIGVNAGDFEGAFSFYTKTLGVRAAKTALSEDSTSWAMLVEGWDASPTSQGEGLRCELFDREAKPPEERSWGHHQNARPSIHVADLPTIEDTLRGRGVSFASEHSVTEWSRSIEFTAPEAVRWSLAHTPDDPAGPGVETPYLGSVELKTAELEDQRDFYTDVMGLTVGTRSDSRVRLDQGVGKPFLTLEPGGERVTPEGEGDSPFDIQPVWLSFETSDMSEAMGWLTDQGVPLIQDITRHDWGGTDAIIADSDGNPIQVVEYRDS